MVIKGLLACGTRALAEASNLVGYKDAQQDFIECRQGMKELFRAGVTSNTTVHHKRI